MLTALEMLLGTCLAAQECVFEAPLSPFLLLYMSLRFKQVQHPPVCGKSVSGFSRTPIRGGKDYGNFTSAIELLYPMTIFIGGNDIMRCDELCGS